LELEDESITIAVDASGLKVSNRGDWIRRNWRSKKGYLKVHIVIDVKTNRIVALEITSEKIGDNRKLKPLVRKAMNRHKVCRVLADGAYDSKENFTFLSEHGIDPAIRIRGQLCTKVPRLPGQEASGSGAVERP